MKKQTQLSATRIHRVRQQGYFLMTDKQISAIAFGNRFAFILCTSILSIGVGLANIPILSGMMVIAALGFILPYHPFDYIYNYLLARRLGKPRLPKRSDQLKFACTLATIGILTTIYMFHQGFNTLGYISGGSIVAVAFTVSTTDLCIPSVIYNALFLDKKKGLTQ